MSNEIDVDYDDAVDDDSDAALKAATGAAHVAFETFVGKGIITGPADIKVDIGSLEPDKASISFSWKLADEVTEGTDGE